MRTGRVARAGAAQAVSTAPPSLDCIRQWMERQFKPAQVSVLESTPQRVCYRVEQGFPSPTLYVPKDVLAAHPAAAIIAALDHHHVAARLRSNPVAHLICVTSHEGIGVVRCDR